MDTHWWQQVVSTVATEFSDLPDAAQTTRMLVRLLMAALLGGLLGWERESKGQAAGVRTHMLVAMGAALFVVVSAQIEMGQEDLSRVIQGIVAGVGFLCAGTILKSDNQGDVKGLTTAAGLWLTAAVGVAAGLGRETTAVLATVLALAILSLMPVLIRTRAKPASMLVSADASEDAKPPVVSP
ncbi:MAG TPA: MgtC/SapB family protein [Polaromonas sp.]|uniref:MgtC/SapB family protein n=1 Tax=Polaromonas sp. TaxID=1869339 RepID=UPI002D485EEA|nr:MgtC/SapB family protein [Polaromonas sp.]HYW56140.1 MgtC/SapB family protein [Polaromonas sp.]